MEFGFEDLEVGRKEEKEGEKEGGRKGRREVTPQDADKDGKIQGKRFDFKPLPVGLV